MSQQIRGGAPSVKADWRFPLLLVCGSALAALLWLGWSGARRPDVNFLPRRGPAEWIVYPTPPQGTTHLRVELSTTFRHEFGLDRPPTEASLRVAAFHRYNITLNGVTLGPPTEPGANWKQPDRFEVAKTLRAGRNEIVVDVFNSNGPPSLWLALTADLEMIVTGENWESSCAGASWRAARSASRPMMMTARSELAGGESTWTSVQRCWPIMLILAAVSVGGWWLIQRRGHLIKAGRLKGEATVFAGLALIWAGLFANNLGALPVWDGFDSTAHMDYVRYIMERKALPLANEGYEMFQPPLYYLVCAGVLKLCHLSLPHWGAVAALRVLGMGIGIAHFFLVWGSLRLLFPQERIIARWGGALAACLPVMIYLSQYVTNEAFAAACVSGCVFLCLWMLRQQEISWKGYAVLGCCLGLAMLAKSTALLVLPPIVGALLWRGLQPLTQKVEFQRRLAQVLGGTALAAAVCGLVCGWHYWRTWKHFGSPFIGVWDPRLGYSYWQDEGYRTVSFFLRFGAALVHPWFSGLNSFGDGIYSTLFGDGLLGGTSAIMYHPPWNYDLMNVGYWLALLPSGAALIGAWLALRRFVLEPRPEWFLVLGLGFLGGLALIHMSLLVPQWCMIKAFYALCALVPFCACAGLGLSHVMSWSGKIQPVFMCWFALWGLTTVGAYWIPYQSVGAVLGEAKTLRGKNRFGEAATLLSAKLNQARQNVEMRSLLVDTLMRAGDLDAAMEQAKTILALRPDDGRTYAALGAILLERGQKAAAAQEYRRAVELAPGLGQGWEQLTKLLLENGSVADAARAAQQGLAADPYSAILHYFLGVAYHGQGQTDAAVRQLLLATLLGPNLAGPRVSLGAILLARGRLHDAADNYAAAVRLDPHNASVHCQLAIALEKQGDAAGAMLHYAEALRLEPGLAEASANLAQLKQRLAKTHGN
jgi:Flp pilus assembly protein TadD/4-amino-4-deoxy-L-arabinose transferase-like glycosyltransferase